MRALDAGKFVLLDGNNLLYRAFFAIQSLTTSDGTPTNAVYGYANMLLRILEEERPEIIVAVFERGRTFRHEAFPDYKGQRPRTPDTLAVQAPLAREITEALAIPLVEQPGYEADDVIGTLACQAKQAGWEVRIVTGDMDALQLVDDRVRVIASRPGRTDTMVYDAAAVREKLGVDPAQVPDLKALSGDPSDNIPGARGVGPKTAAQLLTQHGTVERLLEHLPELPEGRVRKALEEAGRQLLLYKHLATLVTDLPIVAEFETWRYRGPDLRRTRELFTRLEFRTLLKRLPDGAVEPTPPAPSTAAAGCDVRRAADEGELSAWLAQHRGDGALALRLLSPDAGQHGGNATALALAASDGKAIVLVGAVRDPLVPAALVGHDLKHDIHTLWRAGVGQMVSAFDTMVAAYLLNPGRSSYRLSDLAREHLDLDLDAVSDPLERLGCEAVAIGRLRPALEARLEAEGLAALNREVEVPLIGVLARMERWGVAVDSDWLRALSERLSERIAAVQGEIFKLAGREFNVASPKQLQEVLFSELKLPAGKRTKTGFSTGVEVLEELTNEHPIVRLILEYRELAKLKSTYADALPRQVDEAGRIHTSLNQTVAATGRLSSSEPNLQNIPIRTEVGRDIRKAFIPAPGMRLLSADYSQIELRVLAHVTGDAELVRAFQNEEDIHTHSAARLYDVPYDAVTPEQRRRAKTITFAVLYGMSDFGLSKELGISVTAAREMIEAYFARFPGVRRYTGEMIAAARQHGCVTTLSGRKRYLPDIRSANRTFRAFAERAAVNAPIQGTAADIIKRAMVALDGEMQRGGCGSRMILQVHDELLFEVVPEELAPLAAQVRHHMESALPLDVPLRVETKVGENWRDLHPLDDA